VSEERRNRVIYLAHHDEYESGPFIFSGPLSDVIECLEEMLESVPEEYRETTRFKVDATYDCGDSNKATVEICYERPETDAEREQRVERERAEADKRVQWAKQAYERALREAGANPPQP
jgi:hypothetical protein